MVKITPEVKTYFCDRCEKEIKNRVLAPVHVRIPLRDYGGNIVAEDKIEKSICENCAFQLKKWLEGKK